MSTRLRAFAIGVAAAGAALSLPAEASTRVYEDGDRYVEIGGQLQLQYLYADPDDGDSRDRIFFRRLRPYLQGSVTANWDGKIQVDFGEAEDAEEVAIKDAYMRYRGWKNLELYIGNTKTPFSRELLTPSESQQLVERTFVGEHDFGSPERQLGFRLDGQTASKKVAYKIAVGAEHHDPDVRRVDLDTPVNNQNDWNEGPVVAGRIDFMPLGTMKYDQSDLQRDRLKVGFGLGVFTWSNDDDNNTYTDSETGRSTDSSRADLDRAEGIEISVSLRGRGFSADADYNLIRADAVDPTFTGGVYRSGATDLEQLAFEGGYVLPRSQVELVAGWESQDADNYERSWNRASLGINYFWNAHNLKAQFTYRSVENVFGIEGKDLNLAFLQLQFVF